MTHYLVQQYLDNHSNQNKKRIALVLPNEQLTYQELSDTSNKLANLLKTIKILNQDRVALFLKRSSNSIVAMAGVLKADAIYVSIDSKTPQKRLKIIFEDCEPAAIICDRSTVDKVVEISPQLKHEIKIIVLENKEDLQTELIPNIFFQDDIESQSSTQPLYQSIDTDIAQIIYTSGSTGTPKGVMISHANIINYIEWAVEEFQISENDVILGTAPFHFDMSTFDIFCSLKTGCTFCIAPENYMLFPKNLINLIDQYKITIWKSISSLLMYLARTRCLDHSDLPSLKKIIFAGEVFPTKYLIDWMKHYPEKDFYNGYGPSEGTGVSIFYKVDKVPADPKETIPIGKACKNCEVILLKENNILAGIAEIGEICIRGSGVSAGYWNNPEKTDDVFVPNPLNSRKSDRIYRTGDLGVLRKDGNIEFIGRKDQQVKWMGYRIELGEIEATLLSLNEINDAVVMLYNNDGSDSEEELIACVEAVEDADLAITMDKLANQLPNYMIPKRIISVSKIPRSDRGKVDRKKLLEQYSEEL